MMRFHILSVLTMAVAICAASTSVFAAETTHDGRVVSITATKLVMANQADEEHTMTLADGVTLTLDGKVCKVTDLKAGTKIRVTTQSGEPTVASKIEAIRKNATYANTHDGKLVSMTATSFVMTGKDGKEHSHTLATDAKVTCDGKPCKIGDLESGMKIRVTTSQTEKNSAINIEALDKDSEFVSTK